VIEITFNPAGGPVSGSFSGTFVAKDTYPTGSNVATTTESGTLIGNFSGGDGGTLDGTASTQVNGAAVFDDVDNSLDGSVPIGPYTESRGWNGVLYANGTGSGYVPSSQETSGYFIWSVTFPAADFQAGGAATPKAAGNETPVSQDYIQQQIDGLSVEMGDKAWTDHEIQLLHEVLNQLPPALRSKLALQHIVRYTSAWDKKTGELAPTVFGDFSSEDQGLCAGCARSPQTIRIYDQATKPYDFGNDTGDIEFKATILHEMIHALQSYKNDQDTYDNPSGENPLVQDYINISVSGWNGWFLSGNTWVYSPVAGNDPPTNYGMTSPLEDMSESVMMYVYDPQKLQNSSPQRYNYIRDKIFGGVEYENGKQKGK
jgi:hypothetical protein